MAHIQRGRRNYEGPGRQTLVYHALTRRDRNDHQRQARSHIILLRPELLFQTTKSNRPRRQSLVCGLHQQPGRAFYDNRRGDRLRAHPGAGFAGIAVGADGNIWASESSAGKIIRIIF